jgi:pyridoxamine 5'-phosphate oxidase
MKISPIAQFLEWFGRESELSMVSKATDVCLSALGENGFPNARFIMFKEILDGCFIINGPTSSRKGTEIENNNKVALTFWKLGRICNCS